MCEYTQIEYIQRYDNNNFTKDAGVQALLAECKESGTKMQIQ